MGLIDHDSCAGVLLLQCDDLGQLAQVALHREHAIDNDEFHDILGTTLQQSLQLCHIVVLVLQALREAVANAVHDARMVAVVADDEVVAVGEHAEHTAVDGETCGEAHRFLLADIFSQFFL